MKGDAEPDTRIVAAPAKINPFLRVLGRRGDGYHELETLILPVSLADEVRVHAYADPSMFRTLSFRLDVIGEPALTRGVPVDESNLALRAAAALAGAAGSRGFADIVIDKRVPAAAGLGGGSSDAAAALLALNVLWGAALSREELGEVGASVGSDVPALLYQEPVVARGRGERLEPAAIGVRLDWLLVTFPFGVRTKDAFGWWDHEGGTTGPDPSALLAALADGDAAAAGPLLFNDLEAPVFAHHPDLGDVKEELLRAGLAGAVMCGSGASLAGLIPPDHDLESVASLAAVLNELKGAEAVTVRSVASGARQGRELTR
jgi:4-diphosphocytidyl-2-C-methyl-D-erythritol kinase